LTVNTSCSDRLLNERPRLPARRREDEGKKRGRETVGIQVLKFDIRNIVRKFNFNDILVFSDLISGGSVFMSGLVTPSKRGGRIWASRISRGKLVRGYITIGWASLNSTSSSIMCRGSVASAACLFRGPYIRHGIDCPVDGPKV
jgi:hypothetical protein